MDIGERLVRVESGFDWIKVMLALIATFMISGFAFLGIQINRLDGKMERLDGKIDGLSSSLNAKLEAIPLRLSEEFRAMRAEMAAQTSAIANSITATRQEQPPAPPQIIVIPSPQTPPTPAPPPKSN
jgi:hypothetical protein